MAPYIAPAGTFAHPMICRGKDCRRKRDHQLVCSPAFAWRIRHFGLPLHGNLNELVLKDWRLRHLAIS